MKTIFVGAVEGSRIALEALIASGMAPDLVVTLPPDLAQRHSDFSDLSGIAHSAGSKLHFTKNINAPETITGMRVLAPDLLMVIGWSQICRSEVLGIARFGALGFHPALLPRLRGRAVIPWTILLDEKESGSTLFRLDSGTDSGPIVLQKCFPVSPDETARSLYDKHTDNLAAMLPEAVSLISSGKAPSRVQDHGQASYCAKRTPEDGLVDWSAPAESILRLIRAAGSPYPGAYVYWGESRLIIDHAALAPNSHQYIGLTGQVQSHTDGPGFTVRCGDGKLIEIISWRCEKSGRPRLHTKLNGDK